MTHFKTIEEAENFAKAKAAKLGSHNFGASYSRKAGHYHAWVTANGIVTFY